jgi:hypothetical protein
MISLDFDSRRWRVASLCLCRFGGQWISLLALLVCHDAYIALYIMLRHNYGGQEPQFHKKHIPFDIRYPWSSAALRNKEKDNCKWQISISKCATKNRDTIKYFEIFRSIDV